MQDLIKIQAELKAPKGQFNAFGKYNYRNCEDILEALKPLLFKHNCTLTITDEIKYVPQTMYVEAKATIVNSSGEVISVTAQAGIDLFRKGMDVAQSFGSSSSYARKYALNGLFLIDDTKDADATNNHKEKPPVKEALTDERFLKAMILIEDGKYSKIEMEEKYALTQVQQVQLNKINTNK